MAKKRTLHHSCQTMRRKLVTKGTLDLGTGTLDMNEQGEWVTEPCNVPLFTQEEKERGTCRSCNEGWTHPNNYPI